MPLAVLQPTPVVWGIDTLSYLAMERCKSSKEAVELMGSLAVQYGHLASFAGASLLMWSERPEKKTSEKPYFPLVILVG